MTASGSRPGELSADEARRMALWAQGLVGTPYGRRAATGGPRDAVRVGRMLSHLGAVQLDTISVLARSHELVAFARLGPVGKSAVESAYWSGDSAFEYWSHAACILPMPEWQWFAFRRRHYSRRGQRWHGVPTKVLGAIVQRLRDEGPLTTRELGGARASSDWWDWSEGKIAVEWLLDIGVVVVSRRVGWRRVYDLAERVVPAQLREASDWPEVDGIHGPGDAECLRRLTELGGRSVGVGTAADIADIHRLRIGDVTTHIGDTELVPVTVAGWNQPAWAAPEALAWLSTSGRGAHRTTLLSPFDSLIWNRDRMDRVFGMEHRIEAYTPAAQRVHGYFAMPVLHRGRLVARVDPAREGRTLVARRVTLHTDRRGRPVAGATDGVDAALAEAARWVGADEVRIDDVRPDTSA